MKRVVLRGFLIALCLTVTSAGGFLVGKNISSIAQEFLWPSPEHQLERKIEDMLGLVVGTGHVMAFVHADTDPVQEVRHIRQLLPQNTAHPSEAYAINETTQTRNGQQLNRLYVTVLIDGMSAGDLYQHPTAYQTEQMLSLIQNVVGYDKQRQDNIKLVSIPFLSPSPLKTGLSGFLCGLLLMCLGFAGIGKISDPQTPSPFPFTPPVIPIGNKLDQIRRQIRANPRHIADMCGSFVQDAASARRLAILLLALGEDSIKSLFLNMSDILVRRLAHLMAQISHISADKVRPIADEFEGYLQGDKGTYGGPERIEAILAHTFGPAQQATETPVSPVKPQTIWDKMAQVPLEVLKNYLVQEYPQTVALILYHLPTEIGKKLLPLFPENLKIDVLLRLSALSPVDDKTLQVISEQLEKQFASFLSGKSPLTGKEKVSALLSAMDKNTEGVLLQDLYERSPDLAHDIQQGMLLFEDLQKLSDDLFQYLLPPANDAVWALALKGATEQMKQKVSSGVSAGRWKKIVSQMQAIHTPKIKDIDDAQHTLVHQAQQAQLFQQEVL